MAATSSASMDMGGMNMGGGCKISMTWNWYTIDACFIADTWRITSSGMFAGSCIGVILLVIVLEGLRPVSREYDALLVRKRKSTIAAGPVARSGSDSGSDQGKSAAIAQTSTAPTPGRSFKPTLAEQMVRATLHMLQFAVAYFVMLLAMYFNGYIIICILIGAFIGAFAFSWQSMAMPGEDLEIAFCCG
ncbi:hypothetical protein B0A48_04708 [Cryoendolithus antarcticus]|uniref:Copper transport protein n=1 Tax=Cryoendolithus antarcticus TaxID=1507870 RepID=A0A1V8TD48_9PEZI|nr:hypothetical protein B0A48_04708 [Cryoendolithus antarcticus]